MPLEPVIIMNDSNKDKFVIPHFRLREFACKDDSSLIIIHPKIFLLTDVLRNIYNAPIIISSAYRTVSHNQTVGGVHNSYHLVGKAIDFTLPSNKSYFVNLCQKIFPFCIVKSSYIHCDVRYDKW